MPELPEVEITRRSFAQPIRGALITDVRLGAPLRWPLGINAGALVHRRIMNVDRRGKYLILNLAWSTPQSNSDPAGVLLIHLGMSGRLLFAADLPPPDTHDHFDLFTSQGQLRLHDPRRFGSVVWSLTTNLAPASKFLGDLGIEPLSVQFTSQQFYQDLQYRSGPIKQVLLAGNVVVGVGNIYASEALFKAKIRPDTPANRVTRRSTNRLHAAIIETLTHAIERGGSTLRDFASADGQIGYFQLDALVYGREGEPCPRCGRLIRLMRQGQRATYYCANCQRY
jgi:formamidopyrimidine-DNA glycosylase